VDRCLNCQYYDRQASKADSKGTAWGQCRRTAPSLSPINAKAYMIEGVWPTVRDDDWCGEWKAGGRRPEPRIGDLMGAGVPTPLNPPQRIAPLTTLSPAAGAALAIGANGRGSD
jgi:hypothetical protein